MKAIDIKKQPAMGPRRAFTMTLHGIRYRLFRSFVTVMVIVVAVAFLMNVACESLIKKAVADHTREQVHNSRLAVRWASRLSRPRTIEEILRGAASADAAPSLIAELRDMGGLSGDEMETFRDAARKTVRVLDFFAALDYAKARQLCHRSRGTAILDRLLSAERLLEFEADLASLTSLRFPIPSQDFRRYLSEWPGIRAMAERVRQGHQRAVERLAPSLNGKSALRSLQAADGSFGNAVRSSGFRLDARDAGLVSRLATDRIDMQRLEASIGTPTVRSRVASHIDRLPNEVDLGTLWDLLGNRRSADWYTATLGESDHPARAIGPDRMLELARLRAVDADLARSQRLAVAAEGGLLGLGERMSWLLIVSMVVCIVGIANAMLMAVTERFREIATLKCLGALDGTIMMMFVIEASLFGAVGGVLGTLLGALIGMGRMVALFRGLALAAMPTEALLAAMAVSLVFGIVLAAVASVYPSFKAARLAPMEAMRIE